MGEKFRRSAAAHHYESHVGNSIVFVCNLALRLEHFQKNCSHSREKKTERSFWVLASFRLSHRSVSLPGETRGGTPRELAGEDACATMSRALPPYRDCAFLVVAEKRQRAGAVQDAGASKGTVGMPPVFLF